MRSCSPGPWPDEGRRSSRSATSALSAAIGGDARTSSTHGTAGTRRTTPTSPSAATWPNDPGNLAYARLLAGLPRRPRPVHRLLPALPVAHRGCQRGDRRPDRLRPSSSRPWPRCSWRRCCTAWSPSTSATRIGLWTAAFLLVFPTAYFLHIGYTESLFLALAFGSMWLARTNRWWLAGLLGRARGADPRQRADPGAGARRRGLPPMARRSRPAAARRVAGDRRRRDRLRDLPRRQPGVYGDPFAFSEIQREHWFKDLTWPWVGIAGMVGWLGNESPDSAFMLRRDGAALHRARVRRDGRDRALAAADLGASGWSATGSSSSAPGSCSACRATASPMFGIMVLAAMIADRWRVAGWILAARIGGGDGATSPGASARASGRSEPDNESVPKEPRRSLR